MLMLSANDRYSTTSVYTELRDGAREGDDGSRLLTIENHLGVPVVVTLEDDGTGGDGDFSASASSAQDKARSFRMKKAGCVFLGLAERREGHHTVYFLFSNTLVYPYCA